MATFAVIMIVLFVGFAIVAIACGIWQINLAINHPEKYERLRKWEKDFAEQHEESMRKAGEKAKTVGAFALKAASTILKK